MSTSVSPGPNESPSVTELISGIVGDLQDLGTQHLALFRNEINSDLRRVSEAATSLVVGVAVLQVGIILLCQMLAHGLSSVAPAVSLATCYGIVGGTVALIGLIAIAMGIKKWKSVESLPNRTAQVLKDDVQWLTKQ
ncbi:phage holin family protein [Schlesneria paludicola]|uniref:phage holin family protein n=1 Tax=Schlesneria paludicola TaxID=360056 RepID=UPI00029A303C|nr:phage holin family protein [Schlesneria paludicola]